METTENKTENERMQDAADKFVRFAVAGLAVQGDLCDADAARLLLRAVARWFGIDFIREAEALDKADEEAMPVMATVTHGDNHDCPKVRSGEWPHCLGHRERK